MTIRGQISLAEATLAPRIGSFWALPEMNCEKGNKYSSCICGSADYKLLAEKYRASNEFIVIVIITADLILIKLGRLDRKERHR
jgi:hypothetical protein